MTRAIFGFTAVARIHFSDKKLSLGTKAYPRKDLYAVEAT